MGSNRNVSRLKQRLARMFKPSSLLRSSCTTSTSAATILSSTDSSRTLLHDVAREPVFVPRHHRHQRVDDDGMFVAPDSLGRRTPSLSIANGRHHVASVLPLSLDCGGCRPTRNHSPLVAKREKGRHGRKKKTERRVRETGGLYVTGEGEGKICPPVFPSVFPSSPSKGSYYYYCFNEVEKREKKEEEKKKKKKKKKSTSYGFSTSSVDSDDGYEFFTSENGECKEEETETFFSSRSFSSDSTEFYQCPIVRQADVLPTMLRSAVRRLYKCPACRIAVEASKSLDRALSLVRRYRRSSVLHRVVSITIGSTDFCKALALLDASLGDLCWLLSIYSSDDPSDGGIGAGGGLALSFPPHRLH